MGSGIHFPMTNVICRESIDWLVVWLNHWLIDYICWSRVCYLVTITDTTTHPITLQVINSSTLSLNSLTPGRSECDSKNAIFNLVLLTGIFRSSYDNALRWMPQDLTDDKSTLVQVMAWCRQATSHYLKQRWLSSLSPYGVARQQWVNRYWWLTLL